MTGCSRLLVASRWRTGGFSLLELLVVVFIIGILATMFTLSVGIGGGDEEIERELDRLEALLQLASEEATLQGRELGLRFYRDGYEFAVYEEAFDDYPQTSPGQVSTGQASPGENDPVEVSEWMVLTQESTLRPRRLPAEIELELEIDGRAVMLDDEESDEEPTSLVESEYRPQIFIFSSGEISPFVIAMRREFENQGAALEVKADGTIALDWGEL